MSIRMYRRSLVYGVGVNDADYEVCRRVNGETIWCPFYRKWHNMLERCYSKTFQKYRPTYIGCSVDPVWHRFSVFRAWLIEQKWEEGLHLDKDLVYPGNKVYGPEFCCVVPQALNSLLNSNEAQRGNLPIGVSRRENGRFQSRVCVGGKGYRGLGTYDTKEEAYAVWVHAKCQHLMVWANHIINNPKLEAGLLLHAEILTASVLAGSIQ